MVDLQRLLPAAAPDGAGHRRAELATRIGQRVRAVTDLDGADDAWERWFAVQPDNDELVDELVAMFMTRLLREHGIGPDVFDAAEALLGELALLAGFEPVVLGQTQDSEMADHDRGSIALRFPGTRVWELPFLVHEFGHHAVPRLRTVPARGPDEHPLETVVTTVAETIADPPDARARSHAGELVADAFATVVCGPTYPLACLCLRTPRPAAASTSSPTHPAWTDRMATMRTVLDVLAGSTGLGRFRWARVHLIDPLTERALGVLPAAGDAAAAAAEETAAVLTTHRPDLVYVSDAITVADALQRGDAAPPAGTSVRCVLDAAWRTRIGWHGSPDDDVVADRALSWCAATLTGGNP